MTIIVVKSRFEVHKEIINCHTMIIQENIEELTNLRNSVFLGFFFICYFFDCKIDKNEHKKSGVVYGEGI